MACLGSSGVLALVIEEREARRDLRPGEVPVRLTWAAARDVAECAALLCRQAGRGSSITETSHALSEHSVGRRARAPLLIARDFDGRLLGALMATTGFSAKAARPETRIAGPFVVPGPEGASIARRLTAAADRLFPYHSRAGRNSPGASTS